MNKTPPYQQWALDMLNLISKNEGWEETKEHYLKLWTEKNPRKIRKYANHEEAYEAHKKQALACYYRRKGVTLENIQKKIDEKRLNMQNKVANSA